MKKKQRLIVAIAAPFVFSFWVLVLLIFRPVPIPAEEDCLIEKGIVENIYEGSTYDIVFRLEGNNRTYYINRGLELGLTIDGLRSQLMNQEITLKYPKYWTPLDPNNRIKHLSKLEIRGETVFDELN